MNFLFNDGGRKQAGFRGTAGDCTVRAIAIATQTPYMEVYNALFTLNRRINKNPKKHSPRDGTTKLTTTKRYLKSKGWTWVPTMFIGQGCRVHLKEEELPKGRLIVRVSKHLVAVIDGVVNDTFDCTRDETRCVYGYFIKEEQC